LARVAIVGSRNFRDLKWVRSFVRSLPAGTVVVSGGARGVDRVAATEAIKCGLCVDEYPAEWDRLGKSAGFARNQTIVDNCDELHAFWDGQSNGTKHTIELARRAGVNLYIHTA
jgi:hypothetical protein